MPSETDVSILLYKWKTEVEAQEHRARKWQDLNLHTAIPATHTDDKKASTHMEYYTSTNPDIVNSRDSQR